MSTFLKVMLALLLTVPLAAYIAGTLVASQADMPVERMPVVLEGSPSGRAIPSSDGSPQPSPTSRPTSGSDDRRGDDDDDDKSDDDVRVVRPTPRDLDDDHGDDIGDDHGGDSNGSDDGSHDD